MHNSDEHLLPEFSCVPRVNRRTAWLFMGLFVCFETGSRYVAQALEFFIFVLRVLGVLPACLLCTTRMQHPRRLGEGVRSSGIGVTVSCEPLGRCWELNQCPLQEQPVLLTAEPCLQAQY